MSLCMERKRVGELLYSLTVTGCPCPAYIITCLSCATNKCPHNNHKRLSDPTCASLYRLVIKGKTPMALLERVMSACVTVGSPSVDASLQSATERGRLHL